MSLMAIPLFVGVTALLSAFVLSISSRKGQARSPRMAEVAEVPAALVKVIFWAQVETRLTGLAWALFFFHCKPLLERISLNAPGTTRQLKDMVEDS